MQSKKKSKMKKWMNDFDPTIGQTVLFCGIVIIIFIIVMIIIFCKFQSVPDTLIVGFFALFSAEGGFLTYLHKLKKERENTRDMRAGDVTGFDDAEVIDDESDDVPDESDLVIDTEGEEY